MSIGSENLFQNIVIGGIAGGFSRSITAPLEMTKIMQQNYPNTFGRKSIISIIKKTYNTNGLRSLFKGNLSNCIRIIPQNAIQLAAYNYSSKFYNEYSPETKNRNAFLSGATAGILSYTAIYPLETIRSKMTVNIDSSNNAYNSIFSTLRSTYRSAGLRSLYRGWQVSVLGMIPYQGITFMTYRYLRENYNPNKDAFLNVINGSIAGICAVSVTYPCDVLKRKYHLSGEMGNKQYKNYADIIRTTYSNSGISGFYRGIASCYIKMVPSSALFFLTVELCNKYIKE
tara:strand:+ start:11362 stop:12216 length:855 start_codon:yes stop_codon:yes gene_type:complete